MDADGESVIIMDINTGQILQRIPTGVDTPSQSLISVGYKNDIFYAGFKKTTLRIFNSR